MLLSTLALVECNLLTVNTYTSPSVWVYTTADQIFNLSPVNNMHMHVFVMCACVHVSMCGMHVSQGGGRVYVSSVI